MDRPSTEARDALLAAYRDDLQRQMGRAAAVDRLLAHEGFGVVVLTATARVGTHRFEITGFGENIVTAYADLLRSAPEVALTASFRQLVDV